MSSMGMQHRACSQAADATILEQIMAQVVCIEDEADMLDLMRLLITRQGYEFYGARGGREGLLLISQVMPDLILLDLMMPDMDGWEVYAQLKAGESTRHIPVIIVTGRARTHEQLLALRETGVDDYIVKPFGPAQLMDSVACALVRAVAHRPA